MVKGNDIITIAKPDQATDSTTWLCKGIYSRHVQIIHAICSLSVGQSPVLKLLSRRFWGLSPHKFAWNLAPAKYKVGRRIFGAFRPPPQKKNEKTIQNCQANPLPDVGEIRKVCAGNQSTKVFNIWCDLVGKLGIYRLNTAMGHFPPKNFRSPLAPKLLVRLKKKSRVCKMIRASSIFTQSLVEIRRCTAAWERKVGSFFPFYRAACNADAVLRGEFCPSVRPSVRLSHACIVTKRKENLSRFLYRTKDNWA